MTGSLSEEDLRPRPSLYATAIGYSALCFLPAIIRLSDPEIAYHRGSETFHRIFLPILLCQLGISVLFLAAIFVVRRLSEPLRSIAALLLLFWPIDAAAQALLVFVGGSTRWQKILASIAFIALLLLARSLPRLRRWIFSAFLFAVPGSLLFCGFAAYVSFRQETTHFQDRATKQSFHSKPLVRVVWVIFDELDPDVLLTHRPQGLVLPNVDKLLASSLSSVQVHRAGMATRNAIPALLIGREVIDSQRIAPDDLLLHFSSGDKGSFQASSNVFDDASALRVDSAIVGWYHPYGRVLGDRVNRVVSRSAEDFFGFDNQQSYVSLPRRAWNQLLASFSDLLLFGKTPWVNRTVRSAAAHMQREIVLEQAAQQWIGDDNIGLLFLHLPIPHEPAIWNRKTQKYDLIDRSYVDSLALVDRVLATVVQTLDKSGLAGRTALIVTGDHGWRRGLWRNLPRWTRENELTQGQDVPPYVPFLLKMPMQNVPLPYPAPFDATLSRKLVRGILSGEFRSAEQVARWLDQQPAPKK